MCRNEADPVLFPCTTLISMCTNELDPGSRSWTAHKCTCPQAISTVLDTHGILWIELSSSVTVQLFSTVEGFSNGCTSTEHGIILYYV